MSDSGEKLVEVYAAKNEMEARVVKGLLESFGIPSLFKSNAALSVHPFTVNGMAEIKILVRESMAEEAMGLIERNKDV